MKLPLTIVTALTLAATSAFAGWTQNYDKALEQAAQEKKLVLLDFTGSDWCGWCMKLDKETFSKPAFKDFADKNLVLVTVDFPQGKKLPASVQKQNDDLKTKFQVNGFPTLILVDGTGKEIARNPGYLAGGPAAFVSWVESARK